MPPPHDDVGGHSDQEFQHASPEQLGDGARDRIGRVSAEAIEQNSPKRPGIRNALSSAAREADSGSTSKKWSPRTAKPTAKRIARLRTARNIPVVRAETSMWVRG